MPNTVIPTYVINLKQRTDRKEYILQEFSNRTEFDMQIVEASTHEIGAIGLWNSITKIINIAAKGNEDYIAICEDDHQFTGNYSKEKLFACIADAKKMNADVLSGGISWFNGILQCTENIYWMELFTGTQFLIIFRKFFNSILEAEFNLGDTADYKICSLTHRLFFIFPFISAQKDFGYSDATAKNNVERRVETLFQNSSGSIQLLKQVIDFYNTAQPLLKEEAGSYDIESIKIPTYVINLPERTDRREHIEEQFKGKNEFDVTIVGACRHEIGAVGLWLSIRKIIEIAIANDDDVIIICEDDHEFTEHYSKEILIKNIIEAHYQQADYMLGGSGKFGTALPICVNRVWTDYCFSLQFTIIFKKFFQTILNAPFDDAVSGDMKLSDLTGHKMLLCPFISRQRDFGYSDVNSSYNDSPGLVTYQFRESSNRINLIHDAYIRFAKV